MIASLPELFAAFGGPAGVAEAANVSLMHARQMRRRGSIPVSYWPALLESPVAKAKSITTDTLVGLHAHRRPPSPNEEDAA